MPQDVFQAIADPTRRQIIDLLADRPLTVNEVADQFDISRPAISRHIRILDECGLLKIRNEGRKRYCRTDTSKLIEVLEWAGRYSKYWNERLDILQQIINEEDV